MAKEKADIKEQETTAEVQGEIKEQETTAGKDEDELVEVNLFHDNKDYKDDVFVGINGRTWVIKRGEPVKVPKSVAKVLKQSEEQDKRTAKLMQDKQRKFFDEARTKNV